MYRGTQIRPACRPVRGAALIASFSCAIRLAETVREMVGSETQQPGGKTSHGLSSNETAKNMLPRSTQMKKNRRDFLRTTAAAGALSFAPKGFANAEEKSRELAAKIDKIWVAPVLKTEFFKLPVRIASIELLKNGQH